MPKINNIQRYPIKENPVNQDTFIGTDSETGFTRNFRLSDISGGGSGLKIINDSISSSATYQNASLVGVSSVAVQINGMDAFSSGQLSGFNSITGTITFNTVQSGKLTIQYA